MYSFKERALSVGVGAGNGVRVAVGAGITVDVAVGICLIVGIGVAVGVDSPPQVVAHKAPTVSIRTLIEPILMSRIMTS